MLGIQTINFIFKQRLCVCGNGSIRWQPRRSNILQLLDIVAIRTNDLDTRNRIGEGQWHTYPHTHERVDTGQNTLTVICDCIILCPTTADDVLICLIDTSGNIVGVNYVCRCVSACLLTVHIQYVEGHQYSLYSI